MLFAQVREQAERLMSASTAQYIAIDLAKAGSGQRIADEVAKRKPIEDNTTYLIGGHLIRIGKM